MSLRTQAKVLRALEEQRFEPVGAVESVQVDVRVVAATNKNLEEEIERGNFREDLFYRLNVIPFYVPPLRDRARRYRRCWPIISCVSSPPPTAASRKELTPEAYQVLSEYHWPGNVRELQKPDGAHRDPQPAGAHGCAAYSAEPVAPPAATGRSTASAGSRKSAKPPNATTS